MIKQITFLFLLVSVSFGQYTDFGNNRLYDTGRIIVDSLYVFGPNGGEFIAYPDHDANGSVGNFTLRGTGNAYNYAGISFVDSVSTKGWYFLYRDGKTTTADKRKLTLQYFDSTNFTTVATFDSSGNTTVNALNATRGIFSDSVTVGNDVYIGGGGTSRIDLNGTSATERTNSNSIYQASNGVNITALGNVQIGIDEDANSSSAGFNVWSDGITAGKLLYSANENTQATHRMKGTTNTSIILDLEPSASSTPVTKFDSLGTVDGNKYLADTSAFTTTGVRKAISIAGATGKDKYSVDIRVIEGDETTAPTETLWYQAKTDSLIVFRSAGTTSGLKFSYIRIK